MTTKNLNLSVSNKRHYVFILQIIFVVLLLVIWLSNESIRQNKSLWILFFYNFPSEFLIALVPHEPVIFYFGEFYHPLIVSMVAISGTVIAEVLNYILFQYISEMNSIEKIHENKLTIRLVKLFNKAPFPALLIAGFTPVPFYPFRFLVVLAHYPLAKYALAVFLSRAPRFYILALLGHKIQISTQIFILIFVIIAAFSYLPMLWRRYK